MANDVDRPLKRMIAAGPRRTVALYAVNSHSAFEVSSLAPARAEHQIAVTNTDIVTTAKSCSKFEVNRCHGWAA